MKEIKNMSEAAITPKQLLEEIVKIADDRKAKDIIAMHVTEKTTLTDYFVVMTGSSSTHIRALSEEIEKRLKDNLGIFSHHREGVTSNWILLDYTSVVVNIFLSEAREMYALERLWGDAEQVNLDQLIVKED